MSAPNQSPWDTGTPHRPGADDFDGCALTDDPEDPPIAAEMPTSAQQNTLGLTHVSIGKVVPNAVFSVRFSAGSPLFDSMSVAPNALDTSGITVVRTFGGGANGDTTITFPSSSTFPPSVAQPIATINLVIPPTPTATDVISTIVVNVLGNAQIRVVTTKNGALADLPYTVLLY